MKTNTELLKELFDLALEIESKGISSVIFDYTSSIPFVGITLYEGKNYANPCFKLQGFSSDAKWFTNGIVVLKEISEKGITAIPDYAAKQAEIRQKKVAEINRLRAELAA